MSESAFFKTHRRLCFWPPFTWREKVNEGLLILKACHLKAGGTAMLTAAGPGEYTTLVLYGTQYLVDRTHDEGHRMYRLIDQIREKQRGMRHHV